MCDDVAPVFLHMRGSAAHAAAAAAASHAAIGPATSYGKGVPACLEAVHFMGLMFAS